MLSAQMSNLEDIFSGGGLRRTDVIIFNHCLLVFAHMCVCLNDGFALPLSKINVRF